MAIAFNATTNSFLGSGTSATIAHTCAANSVLFLHLLLDTDTTPTAVTYAGSAMTYLGIQSTLNIGREYVHLTPASGTNNISITVTGARTIGTSAQSYTGADRTTNPRTSNFTLAGALGGGGVLWSIALPITTAKNNSWIRASVRGTSDGSPNHATPWVGGTIRNSGTGYYGIADSDGPKTPAGAYTITAQYTRTQNYRAIIMEIQDDVVASTSNNAIFFAGD